MPILPSVLPVENLKDFFCVGVVFRKDNGFAQLLTVVDFDTLCHQHMKHLPNGVLIEDPFIQRRRKRGNKELY